MSFHIRIFIGGALDSLKTCLRVLFKGQIYNLSNAFFILVFPPIQNIIFLNIIIISMVFQAQIIQIV